MEEQAQYQPTNQTNEPEPDRVFRRVEAYLYSIPKKQLALASLKYRLRILDEKIIARMGRTPGSAGIIYIRPGGEMSSREEKWVLRLEALREQRIRLCEKIRDVEQELRLFERVMEEIKKEKEGQALARLVQLKYIEGCQPWKVWRTLPASKSTYYRMRNRVVEIVRECLPGEFF